MLTLERVIHLAQVAAEISADYTADLIENGMEPVHAELAGVELLSEMLFELRDA